LIDAEFGEKWSMPWSFLELGGFAFLICGTLTYNEVFRMPFSTYPPPAVVVFGVSPSINDSAKPSDSESTFESTHLVEPVYKDDH